tara:strand:- start:1035 stop:1220 length:186 start_codon:yes stop_codon:yes gene_type:complete
MVITATGRLTKEEQEIIKGFDNTRAVSVLGRDYIVTSVVTEPMYSLQDMIVKHTIILNEVK